MVMCVVVEGEDVGKDVVDVRVQMGGEGPVERECGGMGGCGERERPGLPLYEPFEHFRREFKISFRF